MKTPKPELIDIKAGKRLSDALPRKASSPMAERVSLRIAETILDGFNRHYQIFMEITQAARKRFEQAALARAKRGGPVCVFCCIRSG